MNKPGEINKYSGPEWVYDIQGNELFWKSKAEELKRSADILWITVASDFEYLQEFSKRKPLNIKEMKNEKLIIYVAVFICGLAIENLIKGILISKDENVVKSGKLRGDLIKSHNLIDLAKGIALELDENEYALCQISTEAIYSFGRFPIPIDVSKMQSMIRIKLSFKIVFDEFYNRLVEEFVSSCKWKKE